MSEPIIVLDQHGNLTSYNGIAYVLASSVSPRPGMWQWLAENKKSIFGVVGGISGVLLTMIGFAPDTFGQWPTATKLFLGFCAAMGYTAGHMSSPDKVVPPVVQIARVGTNSLVP